MTKKQKRRVYSCELKREAVQLFHEEGLTRGEIATVLGVASPENIKRWLREYRLHGEQAFKKSRGRPQKTQGLQAYIEQLEMENVLLKKYRTELCRATLARRNIGPSTIIGRNTP